MCVYVCVLQSVAEAKQSTSLQDTLSSLSGLSTLSSVRPATTVALLDAITPSAARPDVGVRSKAASIASQAASVRSGAEGLRQNALRTGALVTATLHDSLRGDVSTLGNTASSAYFKLAQSSAALKPPASPIHVPGVPFKSSGMLGATYEVTMCCAVLCCAVLCCVCVSVCVCAHTYIYVCVCVRAREACIMPA
jgi:hypothetical protein